MEEDRTFTDAHGRLSVPRPRPQPVNDDFSGKMRLSWPLTAVAAPRADR